MDRRRLFTRWEEFYSGHTDGEALALIEGRASRIVRMMIRLARYPGRDYHGIFKRKLEVALGMSLGVHRQLAAGLTSSSWRGKIRREAGGTRLK